MISVFRESGFPVEVRASAGRDRARRSRPRSARTARRASRTATGSPRSRPSSTCCGRARSRSSARRGGPARSAATVLRTPARRLPRRAYPVNPNADSRRRRARATSPSARAGRPGVSRCRPRRCPSVARECADAGRRARCVVHHRRASPRRRARARRGSPSCSTSAARAGCGWSARTAWASSTRDPAVAPERAPSRRADVPAGPVGFASQSGAFGAAAIDGASRRGIGLSAFVSLGDKADLSSNDVLQYWEQDPATQVVALYLESFGNPRKFGRVARRVARAKPVLAVKAGRLGAGARAAASHTGALIAASDITVDALFAQRGRDPLRQPRRPARRRRVLAEQPPRAGGARRDRLQRARARALVRGRVRGGRDWSRRSPLDLGAAATAAEFAAALEAAAGGADALIAVFVPALGRPRRSRARARRRSDRRDDADGRVHGAGEAELAALGSGARAALPQPGRTAARALGRVVRYARWRERPAGGAPELDGVDADAAAAVIAEALTRGEDWLRPGEAGALAAYGIRTPRPRSRALRRRPAGWRPRWEDRSRSRRFARACRTSPTSARCSRRGGGGTERAAGEVLAAVRGAGGDPDGIVVQRMAAGGVEMVAGVLGDPDLGPVIACGLGGRTVELLGDAAVRLAPLSRPDAAELVRSLRSYPVLEGYRGGAGPTSRRSRTCSCASPSWPTRIRRSWRSTATPCWSRTPAPSSPTSASACGRPGRPSRSRRWTAELGLGGHGGERVPRARRRVGGRSPGSLAIARASTSPSSGGRSADVQQRGRRPVDVRPHLLHVAVELVGHRAREGLEEDAAEGVHVGASVELRAPRLLRRDVVGRADRSPVPVSSLGAARSFVSPKSLRNARSTPSRAVTSTFPGLTSRCTSPRRCASSSAPATSPTTRTARSGASRPSARRIARRSVPST